MNASRRYVRIPTQRAPDLVLSLIPCYFRPQANNELSDKLKEAEETNVVHEAKSISAAASAESQATQIKDLTEATQTLASVSHHLISRLFWGRYLT